jgi:MFS family permease
VYGSTGVYIGELRPTHIRATAVGWFFGIGRIGSLLAPTVVGIIIGYGWGKYRSTCLCSTSSSHWWRTKGRVPEDITQTKPAVVEQAA